MNEDPLKDYGQYERQLPIHKLLPKLLRPMTDIVDGIN